MSTTLAPSFREWAAQTFGIPKGASSPQNEVTDAEAVQSFITWFKALISAWDDEIDSETEKKYPSDTGDSFRCHARLRLEMLDINFEDRKTVQERQKKEPNMDRIHEFLRGAEGDAVNIHSNGRAEFWREWVGSVIGNWASEALDFKGLIEQGQPMADGVFKGMKEFRAREDYMQEQENQSAKDYEREPRVCTEFPSNRTHSEQVKEVLRPFSEIGMPRD